MLCTLPRSPGVMDLHKYALIQSASQARGTARPSSILYDPALSSYAPASNHTSYLSDPAYITLLTLETALEKHIHYRNALLSLQPCVQEILALLQELFQDRVPSRIVSDPLRICHQCNGCLNSLSLEASDTSPSSAGVRLSAVRHALRIFPFSSNPHQTPLITRALSDFLPCMTDLNDKHCELITGPIAQLARLRVELRQLRSIADPSYQPATQPPSNTRVSAPAMEKLSKAGTAGRVERWEVMFRDAWLAVGGTV